MLTFHNVKNWNLGKPAWYGIREGCQTRSLGNAKANAVWEYGLVQQAFQHDLDLANTLGNGRESNHHPIGAIYTRNGFQALGVVGQRFAM